MTDEPLEGIVAMFTMPWKAKHSLEVLEREAETGSLELVDGAVIVKAPSGNLTVERRLELTPPEVAKRGALVGGLLAVLFPPGLLAGAAVGAAVGATVGHFRKLGFTEDLLNWLEEELEAGRSALFVVAEPERADAVVSLLDDYVRVDRQPLDLG